MYAHASKKGNFWKKVSLFSCDIWSTGRGSIRSMNLHLKDLNQRRVGRVHWIPSIKPPRTPLVPSHLFAYGSRPLVLEFIPTRNLTCFSCLSLSTVLAYLLSTKSSLRRETQELFNESVNLFHRVWTHRKACKICNEFYLVNTCFYRAILLSSRPNITMAPLCYLERQSSQRDHICFFICL